MNGTIESLLPKDWTGVMIAVSLERELAMWLEANQWALEDMARAARDKAGELAEEDGI